eukprot:7422944-Karenia_brevis.AAC.1
MPDEIPQGHGSPLVDTMEQATLFAMQHKLQGPLNLELMKADNPQGSAAVSQSHHASMIRNEYQKLSQVHQQGAAAEYQISK